MILSFMGHSSVDESVYYDIDNPLVKITNEEILSTIKYVLSSDKRVEKTIESIPFFIANIISYISDEVLLKDTIGLQKNNGFLKDKKAIKHILDGECFTPDHFYIDRVMILAISYSILIKYELMQSFAKGLDCFVPALSIKVEGRRVYHNLSVISDVLTRESVIKSVKDFENLGFDKQENEMNKLINQLREQDYRYGTKYNTPHIDYVSESKRSIAVKEQNFVGKATVEEEITVVNPYPRIFKEGIHYQLLCEFIAGANKKTPLAGMSFLFRRMVQDGFIFEEIKQREFCDVLQKFDIVVSEKLKSLDNCKTKDKERVYSVLKDNLNL